MITQQREERLRERERERERKVFVCFPHYIIGGPPQRERERISVRNKNETVFKF